MGYVCAECIEEPFLASYVRENASETECEYCEASSDRPISVDLDTDLMPMILEVVERHYEDPANSVSYETAEGGYQLATMDSWDVLEEIGLAVDNDTLQQDIMDGLPNTIWVHRHPYSLRREDALRLSWREFSRLVKHRVRYLLFPPETESDNEGTRPAEMLDQLGQFFIDYQLLATIPKGSLLYRVRVHKPTDTPGNTIEQLGPPPVERARFSNRMSPAGVSLFYSALDEATAIAETYVERDGQPAARTVATFELTEDVTILNLDALPDVPSIFDDSILGADRETLGFLHEFVRDLTEPVEKNRREHIEYVPSQVVTEYVRYRLEQRAGVPIRGIVYPSARVDGGKGCVLFIAYEDINDRYFREKPPFVLLEARTRTEPVDTTPLG